MTRLFSRLFAMLVVLSVVIPGCWGQSAAANAPTGKSQGRIALNSARPAPTTPILPLEFETNRGQAPAQFDFVAHGDSYALGISAREIALTISWPLTDQTAKLLPATMDINGRTKLAPVQHAQLSLTLLGADAHSKARGLRPKAGFSNYFIGNDPAKWHTQVPHFGSVEREGVYPGIDLLFYGNPQQLEYDFHVAAGADPHAIRIAAKGASAVGLDEDGNLILTTTAGDVRLKRPNAYQVVRGTHEVIASSFRLDKDHTIGLVIGAYDHSQPLVIDPVLTYGSAFGGSNGNQALGMDVDPSGNVYLTGNSCSSDFPTTAGAFQYMTTDPAIYQCQDAIALKLDPTASRLIYADYFGGTGASTGTHAAVDASGDLFVTGATTSPNFPLMGNIGPSAPHACPLFQAPQYCPEGFVLKLSPDGSSMAFSTLIGGDQTTVGFQVKLNPVTGDVDVLGSTDSSTFQPTMTGPQTTYQGGTCDQNACLSGFLLGLDPASGALRYGTFLGGTGSNYDTGLGFDPLGNIYVAGATQPPLSSSLGSVTHTYPPANGAVDSGMDILVTQLKLNQNRLSVGYLTVIQGEGDDIPSGLTVDAAGNAYLTGSTSSLSLPVTSGVYQSTNKGGNYFGCLWTFNFPPATCGTIFVGKVDPTGALSFLTYLGGSGTDWGEAIGVDSTGNIWLTAATASNDFPFTADHYGAQAAEFNPLLAEMSNNGLTLSFASQVGGYYGRATDLKIDSSNNVYLTGYAYTAPITPGTYSDSASPLVAEQNPIFVQKWAAGPEPVLTLSATSLAFGPTSVGTISPAQTVTLSNTGAGPLELGIQTVSPSATSSASAFLETDNCGAVLAPNSSCTLTVRLEPFPSPPGCTVLSGCAPQTQTGAIVIQNNAPSGTQQITLTGTSGVGPIVAIAPKSITFPAQIAGTSSATEIGTPGATQSVQISNLGDLGLVLSSATLTGPDAADFQLTNSCPASLPPGFESSCQLSIVFSPAAAATGNRTASITLVDNAADSPQSIPITGPVTSAAAALYYYPTPIDFGHVLIGGPTYDAQMTVDVTNISSAPLVQVTGVTFGGPNAADFHLLPNGNNGLLALNPGAEGAIGFYFDPTSGPDGPRTATATLTTNPVIPGLAPIPLQGVADTGTDPGISIYSNPSPLDLGSVQVGQSSQGASTYLLIGNGAPLCTSSGATNCGGSLVISSIVFGLNDYSVVVQQGSPAYCLTSPITIPVAGQCGFSVVFAPTQAGSRNTTLTINSNDPSGAVILPVTGVGLALPLGNLSATGLNFGYAAIGVASPPLMDTLTNVGASPLTVSSVSASANFAVQSNGCSTTLSPGASCTIAVTFTPPRAGSFSGTLTVSDNDALDAQQTVALSGVGATGASLMISPLAINFGNQAINTVGTPQPVTLTNFGDTVITFPANAFGLNGLTEEFAISSNTCGNSLPIHASCVVNLEFDPVVTMPDSGTLTITDNARGNPQRVALVGNGLYQTVTTLMSSANPSATGQAVTFTATVSGLTTSSPLPTGSVTFFNGTVAIGSAALNGSAQATLTTSALPAGTDAIKAVYSSDLYYAASTSAVLSQVVGSSNQIGTRTALVSTLNPSTVGQSVTFTATVAGTTSNSPLPTGTVNFYDGPSPLGSGTLGSTAQASFSTTTLAAGSHSITAVYGSDSNYAASTSPTVTQVVNAAPLIGTTTTVVSSLNPATAGQSVTFTATVAGTTSNSPVPSGSVIFYDGTTSLGSGSLNGSAQTSFTTSALAVGSHSITAAYGASSTYAPSTSSALTEVVTAAPKAATTTTISSSANPSVTGMSISFTATVTGVGASTPDPTGTVNFFDGATMLGSGTLNSSGTVSFATSSLTLGTHSVTAQYLGDSNYLASVSTALSQVVSAAPSFSLSLSPSMLTVTAGQSGTSTLTVTSNGGFNQPVSFACSGLPQYAACSFSPASVTPSANASITSTVSIATDVAAANLRRDPKVSGRDQTYLAIVGLGLIGLLRTRRKGVGRKVSRMRLTLLFALLGFIAIDSVGCGGKARDVTPPGGSSITITASAGAVQMSQTLAFTVQ